MVDVSKFDVGGNLALTTGSIVLRTGVFELIHYMPQTAEVYEKPRLVVPPPSTSTTSSTLLRSAVWSNTSSSRAIRCS